MVSLWRTPALMSKKLVSPSGDLTNDLLFLYSIIMAVSLLVGGCHVPEEFSLFFPYVQNRREMYKSKVACRSFAMTPSIIRRTIKICPTVDIFFRKPFFFRSTFSTSGCILLGSIEL